MKCLEETRCDCKEEVKLKETEQLRMPIMHGQVSGFNLYHNFKKSWLQNQLLSCKFRLTYGIYYFYLNFN